MSYTIINDNNITHLKTLEDNSIDSIITDPPYGIEFLGKDWDTNTGAVETWQQCLRVLKPGGYLLAFSAARTYHHLATNIQQVGFEIRDQLMWLYASGFPKAQDIGKSIQRRQGVEKSKPQDGLNAFGLGGANVRMNPSLEKEYTDKKAEVIPTSPEAKQWHGWKTSLKPAHEPIVMARKPFRGSTIDNVLTHGVGALNIDATRIAYTDNMATAKSKIVESKIKGYEDTLGYKETHFVVNEQGRYPSNVLGEIPDYQKYFYCPKVSRRERHVGFEQTNIPTKDLTNNGKYVGTTTHPTDPKLQDPLAHIPTSEGGFLGTDGEWATEHWHGENGQKNKAPLAPERAMNVGNNHPTVKPVELMKYLIKLVTPPNSTVLDPFCGSGSTGMAAVELGHTFTGIELDADYCKIAKRRIEGWNQPKETGNTYDELFEEHDA